MERNWCRLEEEEAQAGTERAFTTYGVPLSQFTSFKYLERALMAEDDDWPAVVRNLRRARQKWVWLTRILIREGANSQILGQIYLEAVQSAVLYWSDTWVLTPCMNSFLVGLYHRVARRLTGRQPRKGRYRGCIYPPLEDAMAEVGLQEVETYVSRLQKTVA